MKKALQIIAGFSYLLIFQQHQVFAQKKIAEGFWHTDCTFKTDSLYNSPQKQFQLKFNSDGDLILLFKGHKYFTTNTKTLNAKKCMFKRDAGLIILNSNDSIVWRAIPQKINVKFGMTLRQDGNLIIGEQIKNSPPQYFTFINFQNPIWTSNVILFPVLDWKEKCGCNNNGNRIVISNHSAIKWKVKIKHTVPTYSSTDYLEYTSNPVSTYPIGCTRHYCTAIAPNGYVEKFEIYSLEPID